MLSGCGVARQCRCLSIAQKIIVCLRWTIQLEGRQFWFQSRPIDEPCFLLLVSARVGRCCPQPQLLWLRDVALVHLQKSSGKVRVSSDYPGAKLHSLLVIEHFKATQCTNILCKDCHPISVGLLNNTQTNTRVQGAHRLNDENIQVSVSVLETISCSTRCSSQPPAAMDEGWHFIYT